MRELAFRVYDKTEGKYRKLDGLHDTMTLDREGNARYYNLQNGSGGDECIIEQFTGLLDLNGNKIFEGDIVEMFIEGISVGTGKVHYRYGAFRILTRYLAGHPHVVVLGNIHDNPELLEEQK